MITTDKFVRSKQDRVQLIIDWIPNETVRSVDKMPLQPCRPVPVSSGTIEKAGRNEPCPSGLGKKFKLCHGGLH